MKKFIALLIMILAATESVFLAACFGETKTDKISVVCTIFPEYDWLKSITEGGDGVQITLLAESGVDLHSYQPSVEDIAAISACDMFVFVGGESDEWVESVLKTANNQKMKAINLLEVLGDRAKKEEFTEGTEHEHGEEDAEKGKERNAREKSEQTGNEEHGKHDEHEEGLDEHVWLSLKNAEIFCKKLAEELKILDEVNAELYEKNLAAYLKKLAALDEEFESVAKNAPYKTLLFGDRFPFRYLADDYGLKYYAAFAGCAAETEASFETLFFLAKKTDELGLPAICALEGTKHKIAETIRESTAAKNQQIVTFDSMQSMTKKQIDGGASYLSVMEFNLSALKKALGAAA